MLIYQQVLENIEISRYKLNFKECNLNLNKYFCKVTETTR